MSLWYDKKGKTYASKGSSSWVKYYAEHLVNALTARLEGHFKGAEGIHRANSVLVDDKTSVAEALTTKVDKVPGMGLSHQDFTIAEKEKLSGIDASASAVGRTLAPMGAEAFNDNSNTSHIPYSHIEGRGNAATLRTFLITGYTKNTVTLDSVSGIQAGMSWFIFLLKGSTQYRYSGTIASVQGTTVTITGNTFQEQDNELDVVFNPSSTPSLYGTFFVNGGRIGSHPVTDFTGDFSCHIEGRSNKATLDAHGEGMQTMAYGWASHTEGKGTTTTGECSHAEGYNAQALGIGSHAEGGSSAASGAYSHAEGGNTVASAKCAHAEGDFSIAAAVSSHAEGSGTLAKAKSSHTEGTSTTTTGEDAHAEGCFTFASGSHAHAEGYRCEASADSAHAEGSGTKATNKRAHAEGANSTASGINSHAEGGSTLASHGSSHAEGELTVAGAIYSHAEGLGTIARSSAQHVQGKYNLEDSAGKYAHIVGNGTSDTARSNAFTLDWQGNGRFTGDVYAQDNLLATKNYVDESVAEAGGGDMLRNVYDTNRNGVVDDAERLGGQEPSYYAKQADMDNKPIEKGLGISSGVVWDKEGFVYGSTFKPVATGNGSFAAGFETDARGYASAVLGSLSRALGDYSFAMGEACQSLGRSAISLGRELKAQNFQTVVGRCNKSCSAATGPQDTTGTSFIVGVGTDTEYANAFRVTNDGYCYGQNAFVASGADYAEYFEWTDKNLNNEDRRGYFVTLEGNKIRKATPKDTYILGVVSATPVIQGNAYSEQWQGMYQTDIFGQRLTKQVEVPETIDEKTGQTIPAHTETRFLINPHYDPSKEYLGRNERPEWSAVGMMGQLVVVDDGSCEIDGFCTVAEGGIATAAKAPTSYRVLERLDDSHIRIFLK